jgi:hypothetical protein
MPLGDLPQRDRARSYIAEPLVDRQRLLAADPQRLVKLAAGRQYVSDLPR